METKVNYESIFIETYQKKVQIINEFILELLKTYNIELSENDNLMLKADITFLMGDLETENRKRKMYN